MGMDKTQVLRAVKRFEAVASGVAVLVDLLSYTVPIDVQNFG